MSQPASNEEAKALLEQALPNAEITVNGDGYKYEAIVVSEEFEGMNTLQRHKTVYAALGELITGGALHALSIKAKTPEEVA
ncbi:BolA-like protein [gamma proteobacterium HTCC5015]|nr:BolA-like protein [gamma proteobacterium HTCC5015]